MLGFGSAAERAVARANERKRRHFMSDEEEVARNGERTTRGGTYRFVGDTHVLMRERPPLNFLSAFSSRVRRE